MTFEHTEYRSQFAGGAFGEERVATVCDEAETRKDITLQMNEMIQKSI